MTDRCFQVLFSEKAKYALWAHGRRKNGMSDWARKLNKNKGIDKYLILVVLESTKISQATRNNNREYDNLKHAMDTLAEFIGNTSSNKAM